MPAAHQRRGLPDRWLLPPAPRDPTLATRWESLPFERRRQLAHTGQDGLAALSRPDVEIMVGLARARLATAWRSHATAPVLGWLVLMTLWGFGRSTDPGREVAWLVAGLGVGSVVAVWTAVGAARRLRRARAIVDAVPDPTVPR